MRTYIHYPYNDRHSTMIKFQEYFHGTGRAVDVDLQPPQKTLLGELAMLAYYRAHFDWCRYGRDHVHCSVKHGESVGPGFSPKDVLFRGVVMFVKWRPQGWIRTLTS